MIIPVRCFTCGKVLCDKWNYYNEQQSKLLDEDKSKDVNMKNFDGHHTGEILDSMGLDRICCRRHMLGHVDLIDKIQ